MWWIPLAAAFVLAVAFIFLQMSHNRLWRKRANTYRHNYLQLIKRIERLTLRLTRLEPLLPLIKDHKILDHYEGCIRMLENLLVMFKRIEPFGSEMGILRSAHVLTKECSAKVTRIENIFQARSKGHEVDSSKVGDRMGSRVPTGCYFCSRPFLYAGFSKVKVRMEGETKHVFSCDVCKNALKSDKKVRVLFFLKDGKPVHWSEVSDYNPINDYWNINKKPVVMENKRLELIRTISDGEPTNDNDKD